MDFEVHSSAPEQKAGIPALSDAHDTLMRSFEEFKAANDERLDALARRGDVLIEEKVDRINSALDAQMRRIDELTLRQARPALGVDNKSAPSFSPASTSRRSRAMSGPARARACASSKPRRCRSAPIRTAAIWFRPRSSARSDAG